MGIGPASKAQIMVGYPKQGMKLEIFPFLLQQIRQEPDCSNKIIRHKMAKARQHHEAGALHRFCVGEPLEDLTGWCIFPQSQKPPYSPQEVAVRRGHGTENGFELPLITREIHIEKTVFHWCFFS